MKLIKLFSASTFMLFATMVLALLASPVAAQGSRVIASASGAWTIAGTRVLAFVALKHADGSVNGQWQRINQVNGGNDIPSHGDVVCVSFFDNEAWIGTIANSGLFAGFEGGFRVVDNGQGRKAPPDGMSLQYVNLGVGGAQAYCDLQLPDPALNDIGAGNIRIND